MTPEKRREHSRKWYREHRELARERAKEYYKKNREKRLEYMRQYSDGVRRPAAQAIDHEEQTRRARERYQANAERLRQERRDHYAANKDEIKARRKGQVDRITSYRQKAYASKRLRLIAAKSKPCVDCGGTFPPECMDFDHVRGEKISGVGLMASCSDERFFHEISKCDLVCSNCHRIRTHKEQSRKREARLNESVKRTSAA